MPNFDALPNELRNSIMFVRALGMYKRERRRIGSWGVTYAQGFRWTHGVPVLKDVCRRASSVWHEECAAVSHQRSQGWHPERPARAE